MRRQAGIDIHCLSVAPAPRIVKAGTAAPENGYDGGASMGKIGPAEIDVTPENNDSRAWSSF